MWIISGFGDVDEPEGWRDRYRSESTGIETAKSLPEGEPQQDNGVNLIRESFCDRRGLPKVWRRDNPAERRRD